MILADIELAQRIDGAEARLAVSIGDGARRNNPGTRAFVTLLGTGAAVYAGPGSPANKIIGVGFGEVPPSMLLDDIEHAFYERACAVSAELSTLFTSRGHLLQGFEDVLGRKLTDRDTALEPAGGPHIEPVGASALDPWMDLVITGFEHPDQTGAGSGVAPPPAARSRTRITRLPVPKVFAPISPGSGIPLQAAGPSEWTRALRSCAALLPSRPTAAAGFRLLFCAGGSAKPVSPGATWR